MQPKIHSQLFKFNKTLKKSAIYFKIISHYIYAHTKKYSSLMKSNPICLFARQFPDGIWLQWDRLAIRDGRVFSSVCMMWHNTAVLKCRTQSASRVGWRLVCSRLIDYSKVGSASARDHRTAQNNAEQPIHESSLPHPLPRALMCIHTGRENRL